MGQAGMIHRPVSATEAAEVRFTEVGKDGGLNRIEVYAFLDRVAKTLQHFQDQIDSQWHTITAETARALKVRESLGDSPPQTQEALLDYMEARESVMKFIARLTQGTNSSWE